MEDGGVKRKKGVDISPNSQKTSLRSYGSKDTKCIGSPVNLSPLVPKSASVKDKRPRTPSGQVITPKVSDIRNFLQAKSKEAQRINTVTPKSLFAKSANANSNFQLSSKEVVKVSADQQLCESVKQQTPLQLIDEVMPDQKDQNNSGKGLDVEMDSSSDINNPQEMDFINSLCRASGNAEEESIEDMLKSVATIPDSQKDTPEVMDISVVTRMFSELKLRMDEMNKKFENSVEAHSEENIQGIKQTQKEMQDEIHDINLQLNEYKIRTTILTGALSKMTQVVGDLSTKIDRLEASTAKRMMVITGFHASEKKNTRKAQLLAFFNEQMMIEVDIEDSYQLGDTNPRVVVVTFGAYSDKVKVYENIYMIKDLVNQDGKKLFFKDFQPTTVFENKRKINDAIQRAREADPQVEVEFLQGKLAIKNQLYQKRVKAPDPTEILQMEESELKEILNLKLSRSQKDIVKDNIFVGYSICVNSFEQIQKAYMNVKLANAGARHVVCAWRIPGDRPHEENDYIDDEEHGCGRILLEILKKHGITSRAVFVARYYAGKIGQERFGAYIRAMTQAVNQGPYNLYTQMDQKINSDESSPPPPPAKRMNTGSLKQPPSKGGSYAARVQARGTDRYPKRGTNRGAFSGQGASRNRVFLPRTEEQIEDTKKMRKENQQRDGYTTFEFRNPINNAGININKENGRLETLETRGNAAEQETVD